MYNKKLFDEIQIRDSVKGCNSIDEVKEFLKECLENNVELPFGITEEYIMEELNLIESDIKTVYFILREWRNIHTNKTIEYIISIYVSTYSGDNKYYCRKDIME